MRPFSAATLTGHQPPQTLEVETEGRGHALGGGADINDAGSEQRLESSDETLEGAQSKNWPDWLIVFVFGGLRIFCAGVQMVILGLLVT